MNKFQSKKAADKLSAATLNVITRNKSSFWASFIMQLTRIEDSSIPTACTNGIDLKYNPDFILGLELRYVESLIIHEAAHVFLDHHLRLLPEVHDPKLANKAMDYVINDMLKKEGYPVHPEWLLDPKYQYEGWDWELVYRDLVKNGEKEKQPGEDGDPGEGDAPGNPVDSQGNGPGNDKPGGNQNQPGDVEPMPGKDGQPMGEDERKEKIIQGAVDRSNAQAMAERKAGMSDGLREAIGKLNAEGVANWREILSRFVGEVYKDDYSYLTPNMRYLDSLPGVIMPSLRNEGIAKVGFAIDISGSVSTQEVRDMLQELMLAIETYEDAANDVEVPIIYFTHLLAGEETVAPGDEPNPPKVSGGTSYEPVMDWLHDNAGETEIEAMVIQTDGCCEEWGTEPPVPVLWVLSGIHVPEKHFKPPFGDVVVLGQGDDDNK